MKRHDRAEHPEIGLLRQARVSSIRTCTPSKGPYGSGYTTTTKRRLRAFRRQLLPKPAPGPCRKIDEQEHGGAAQHIPTRPAASAFFENIERRSDEKAREMGFEGADDAYFPIRIHRQQRRTRRKIESLRERTKPPPRTVRQRSGMKQTTKTDSMKNSLERISEGYRRRQLLSTLAVASGRTSSPDPRRRS